DNASVGLARASTRGGRVCARMPKRPVRYSHIFFYPNQFWFGGTFPADDGGRTIATASHIMRHDERLEIRPCGWILRVEYHLSPPIGLRFLNGFVVGMAGSGGGGSKAGPGRTNGVWIFVARLYISQLNGLTCPPEGMPRYSRLKTSSPSAMRSWSRNSGKNASISSAVAFSRIHDCSSPAQTVQNGSVRLQAVDSMAKRACGRRARIGRNAAMRLFGSRAASSAMIHP